MSTPCPNIHISEMSPKQWQSHVWLMTRPDMIECPRGIRMRLTACQEMQKSRKHTVVMRLPDGPDEEYVRTDFLICQGCEHYNRELSRKHTRNEGHTAFSIALDMKREAAREEMKQARIRQSVLIAAQRNAARKAATSKKLMEAAAARKAERKRTLEQKMREAKRLRRKGKSIDDIAIAVHSRRQTVGGWVRDIPL